MPVDEATSGKFNLGIKEQTTGTEYKAANGKSSFLLIKSLGIYHAYIMTLIGDPSYLKGDLTKLDRNKYNKRDSDFTGIVLYSTPKGKFVNAWTYKNGAITGQISPDSASTGSTTSGKEQINTVKTNLVAITTCYTWTQTSSYDGQSTGTVVLQTYCITSYTGSLDSGSGSGGGGSIPVTGTGGGGGGGSTTPTPNPPCVPTTAADNVGKISVNSITVNKVQPLPGDPGSGFPPPDGKVPCTTTTTSAFTIKTDSLKKDFPCAVKLIINKLMSISDYNTLIAPFATNIKPDINWTNYSLAWNSPSPITGSANVYELGNTQAVGRSATIKLNTTMLQNSSELLIAATAIHETLHAYINYNIISYTDGFKTPPNYNSSKPWLYSLDYWGFMNGLPPNYRDHNEMLNDYFTKAVGILKSWDNGAHTDQQYAMVMLYGLDTGDLLPMQGSLNTVFNNMMVKYGITSTQINSYWNSQLNTTVATDKLPANGCN